MVTSNYRISQYCQHNNALFAPRWGPQHPPARAIADICVSNQSRPATVLMSKVFCFSVFLLLLLLPHPVASSLAADALSLLSHSPFYEAIFILLYAHTGAARTMGRFVPKERVKKKTIIIINPFQRILHTYCVLDYQSLYAGIPLHCCVLRYIIYYSDIIIY